MTRVHLAGDPSGLVSVLQGKISAYSFHARVLDVAGQTDVSEGDMRFRLTTMHNRGEPNRYKYIQWFERLIKRRVQDESKYTLV